MRRNLADAPELYSGQHQSISTNSSNLLVTDRLEREEHRNLDQSMLGNIASPATFQGLQAVFYPSGTTHIPQIALEDHESNLDTGSDPTYNGMFQEQHLNLEDDPRLRSAHHLAYDSHDLLDSGVHPPMSMLEESDQIPSVVPVSSNAPEPYHDVIVASNLLTPWGGGAHELGGYMTPSVPHHSHMRSSSSPNLQLQYHDSSIPTPQWQESNANASFLAGGSRYLTLNPWRYSRMTSSRPSSRHSAPADLEQEYFDLQFAAPSPCPSTDSTPSGYPDPLRCNFEDCNAIFTGKFRRGNRGRHILRVHRQTNVYTCNALGCNRSYKRSDALLKHQRSKHQVS